MIFPDAPLWPKQIEARDKAKKLLDKYDATALLMEMGTGKTRVTIEILEDMIDKGARLILIIAPLTVLHVWQDEWAKWATSPVLFINARKLGSHGIDTALEVSKYAPVIVLLNYESSYRLGVKVVDGVSKSGRAVKRKKKVGTTIVDPKWDVAVLDESTAIKTPGSKQSRFIRKMLSRRCRKRLVLTGSGYMKRPCDIWGQINFLLDPREDVEWFPRTKAAFDADYVIPHPIFKHSVLGYRNTDQLVEKLNRIAILLKKSDVLDLEDPVESVRYVELPPRVAALYKRITDEKYAELEEFEAGGGVVSMQHVFPLILKQAQIASGFVTPDDEGEDDRPSPTHLHDEKLKELYYLLDERAGEPTIVVTQANFEEQMIKDMVKKKFKFDAKVLNGSVPSSERGAMIAGVKEDPVFIVKQSVAARGIDLRFADTTIWFSHRFDTEAYYQMRARNHRGGQTKTIHYIHILCQKTIDMTIFNSLKRNLSLAERLETDWRKLF